MERNVSDRMDIQAVRKPQWRTPQLLQDKLVDATNIDNVDAGDDHVIMYSVPLGQTS